MTGFSHFPFEMVHEACGKPAALVSEMPINGMLINSVRFASLDGTEIGRGMLMLCCSCGADLTPYDFKPASVRPFGT